VLVKWIATFAVVAVMPTTVLARGPIASSKGPDYGIGCTFFDDENFQGSSYDAPDGTYLTYVGGDWNDRISSIACTSRCALTSWEDRGLGGAKKTWRGKMIYVGDEWNDRISSVSVKCSAPESPPKTAPVLVPEQSKGPSPFGD
jgi:hypothetical protein